MKAQWLWLVLLAAFLAALELQYLYWPSKAPNLLGEAFILYGAIGLVRGKIFAARRGPPREHAGLSAYIYSLSYVVLGVAFTGYLF